MEDNKIKIGIIQGDINGVGYEVILKMFVDFVMLEFCILVIYGFLKVVVYYCKLFDLFINFSIVNIVVEVVYNCLSVVNCMDDEVKVEFLKFDLEVGKVVLGVFEKVIEEFREGLIDVIVMVFINKYMIQFEGFVFFGYMEYIE